MSDKCPECGAPPNTCWSQSGSMGGRFSCYRQQQNTENEALKAWHAYLGQKDEYTSDYWRDSQPSDHLGSMRRAFEAGYRAAKAESK